MYFVPWVTFTCTSPPSPQIVELNMWLTLADFQWYILSFGVHAKCDWLQICWISMKYTQCVEINDQFLTIMWTLDVVPKVRNQRRKKKISFHVQKKRELSQTAAQCWTCKYLTVGTYKCCIPLHPTSSSWEQFNNVSVKKLDFFSFSFYAMLQIRWAIKQLML